MHMLSTGPSNSTCPTLLVQQKGGMARLARGLRSARSTASGDVSHMMGVLYSRMYRSSSRLLIMYLRY
jgi:hypothetical protein